MHPSHSPTTETTANRTHDISELGTIILYAYIIRKLGFFSFSFKEKQLRITDLRIRDENTIKHRIHMDTIKYQKKNSLDKIH